MLTTASHHHPAAITVAKKPSLQHSEHGLFSITTPGSNPQIQPIIVPDANDTGADGLHTSGDLWKLHWQSEVSLWLVHSKNFL
jgi:hypothetical protein